MRVEHEHVREMPRSRRDCLQHPPDQVAGVPHYGRSTAYHAEDLWEAGREDRCGNACIESTHKVLATTLRRVLLLRLEACFVIVIRF